MSRHIGAQITSSFIRALSPHYGKRSSLYFLLIYTSIPQIRLASGLPSLPFHWCHLGLGSSLLHLGGKLEGSLWCNGNNLYWIVRAHRLKAALSKFNKLRISQNTCILQQVQCNNLTFTEKRHFMYSKWPQHSPLVLVSSYRTRISSSRISHFHDMLLAETQHPTLCVSNTSFILETVPISGNTDVSHTAWTPVCCL